MDPYEIRKEENHSSKLSVKSLSYERRTDFIYLVGSTLLYSICFVISFQYTHELEILREKNDYGYANVFLVQAFVFASAWVLLISRFLNTFFKLQELKDYKLRCENNFRFQGIITIDETNEYIEYYQFVRFAIILIAIINAAAFYLIPYVSPEIDKVFIKLNPDIVIFLILAFFPTLFKAKADSVSRHSKKN